MESKLRLVRAEKGLMVCREDREGVSALLDGNTKTRLSSETTTVKNYVLYFAVY